MLRCGGPCLTPLLPLIFPAAGQMGLASRQSSRLLWGQWTNSAPCWLRGILLRSQAEAGSLVGTEGFHPQQLSTHYGSDTAPGAGNINK